MVAFIEIALLTARLDIPAHAALWGRDRWLNEETRLKADGADIFPWPRVSSSATSGPDV
jgi:hypothetical protein